MIFKGLYIGRPAKETLHRLSFSGNLSDWCKTLTNNAAEKAEQMVAII